MGDSNLTRTTQFPGGGAAERKTEYSYDWRNRQVASKSGVEASESTSVNRPISYTEYDNLGQAIVSEMYDGDGLSITTDANSDGVPDRPSSGSLRAKSAAEYDEVGRSFKGSTFSVDPSSGSVSTNALVSQQWYNARGMVMKSTSPGGMVSKSEFDGLGRTTANYLTDGGGDTGYGDADDVTTDGSTQTRTHNKQNEITAVSGGADDCCGIARFVWGRRSWFSRILLESRPASGLHFALGNAIAQNDERNNRTSYEFDSAGRLVFAADSDGSYGFGYHAARRHSERPGSAGRGVAVQRCGRKRIRRDQFIRMRRIGSDDGDHALDRGEHECSHRKIGVGCLRLRDDGKKLCRG